MRKSPVRPHPSSLIPRPSIIRHRVCRGDGRLLGSASMLRERCGAPLTPRDQPDLDQAMEHLRAALGAQHFEAAWNEGRQTDSDDVIAAALL